MPRAAVKLPSEPPPAAAFSQRKSDLFGERFGAQIERGAVLAFERRAIKAAMDFEFCAAVNGLQRMEALFQGVHVRTGARREDRHSALARFRG